MDAVFRPMLHVDVAVLCGFLHSVGAARALQVDADAGAYAGLALSLQVLWAALLMPLIARWF